MFSPSPSRGRRRGFAKRNLTPPKRARDAGRALLREGDGFGVPDGTAKFASRSALPWGGARVSENPVAILPDCALRLVHIGGTGLHADESDVPCIEHNEMTAA